MAETEPMALTIRLQLDTGGKNAPGFRTVQKEVLRCLDVFYIGGKTLNTRIKSMALSLETPDSLPNSPSQRRRAGEVTR